MSGPHLDTSTHYLCLYHLWDVSIYPNEIISRSSVFSSGPVLGPFVGVIFRLNSFYSDVSSYSSSSSSSSLWSSHINSIFDSLIFRSSSWLSRSWRLSSSFNSWLFTSPLNSLRLQCPLVPLSRIHLLPLVRTTLAEVVTCPSFNLVTHSFERVVHTVSDLLYPSSVVTVDKLPTKFFTLFELVESHDHLPR